MNSRLNRSVLFGMLAAVFLVFTPTGKVQPSNDPKVIETEAPVYPAIAWAARASGIVIVDVEIGPDGSVISAKVSRGHPLLSGVSRAAAMNWRFESTSTGERTRTISLTFDFDPSVCTGKVMVISPYHLRIEPNRKLNRPPEVVSYIPTDSSEQFCPVHKTRLRKDTVEIVYGLVGFKPGYEDAEKKLFPKSNLEAFGGCVIETEINCDGTEVQSSPKYAEVLFCPACRRAQARWSKTPWPKVTRRNDKRS